MIQPIQTIYKGYRFRSRLEARWAVFFDTLGIKWEYEPEGYNLNGSYYLPDFWLPYGELISDTGEKFKRSEYPNAGEFIEIKAVEPSKREKEVAQKLSVGTKHSVNIFVGLPGQDDAITYHFHNSG